MPTSFSPRKLFKSLRSKTVGVPEARSGRHLPDGPTTAPIKDPQPATESGAQQDLNLSQKLWNDAHDILEKDEDKLVKAYVKVLTKFLDDKATDASTAGATDVSADKDPKAKKITDISDAGAIDMSAELKDRTKRQMYMEKLVKEGQGKVTEASNIRKRVGDIAKVILSAKPMIDLAIQNIPQAASAALPWGGVCLELQVSNHFILTWLLISIRSSLTLQKRQNPTLRVSLMLFPEWNGIVP